MSQPQRAFEHWACIYDDKQLLQTAVPFLADGLELGEPVLAVTADGCVIQLQVPGRHDQDMVAQPRIRYLA